MKCFLPKITSYYFIHILTTQIHFSFWNRWALSPDELPTLREPRGVRWILPRLCSNSIWCWEVAEREKRVKKCWSDSVEITQDVSEWYRECQSCRKKSPLQLLRPAEHDLCGRLGFIHTKSTAWKLLLESDSSALRRGSCAITKITKLPGNKFLGPVTKADYQVSLGTNW